MRRPNGIYWVKPLLKSSSSTPSSETTIGRHIPCRQPQPALFRALLARAMQSLRAKSHNFANGGPHCSTELSRLKHGICRYWCHIRNTSGMKHTVMRLAVPADRLWPCAALQPASTARWGFLRSSTRQGSTLSSTTLTPSIPTSTREKKRTIVSINRSSKFHLNPSPGSPGLKGYCTRRPPVRSRRRFSRCSAPFAWRRLSVSQQWRATDGRGNMQALHACPSAP